MKAFEFIELTVYADVAAVQYIKYYIKWLKTSTQIKKTRGKPKLVPRFAAGTSNDFKFK